MEEVVVTKNDEIVMKLLHYFITEKGYNPVVLHGAKDEIWLENLDSEYEIIRIVTNYIHNDEQLNLDLFRTKQILKKIKRKTFSYHMHTLSLFLNLGDYVNINDNMYSNIDCANIKNIKDLKKYTFITEKFPTITNDTNFREKGMELFLKITNDINKKNEETSNKAEDVFKQKKPIVSYILIALNVLCFAISISSEEFFNNYLLNPNSVADGEYFRLFTCIFLHNGLIHLACNMYCLYIIGPQIENFYGKFKYLFIYLGSGIVASLMSFAVTKGYSLGASGAIFGLFGALLYFGYHYRIYLGGVLKSQIIPLIVLNLLLGMFLPQVDNAAHIGGLVTGVLLSMALGVKYKSTKIDRINGIILSIVFTLFLIYIGFNL